MIEKKNNNNKKNEKKRQVTGDTQESVFDTVKNIFF
jgi:hypothetical protein